MTLEQGDKKSLSDFRMSKSREFLNDARANFTDERYKTAINRSYYAALNALRAILILEGANPTSHEGVITMFSLRFIRPGILPVDIIKSFKILLSRRTDVDYGDFDMVTRDDAEDSLRRAEEIVSAVDQARKTL